MALGGSGCLGGVVGWPCSAEIETRLTTRDVNTLRILGGNFSPHRTAFVISTTAAGEGSSIRALAVRAFK